MGIKKNTSCLIPSIADIIFLCIFLFLSLHRGIELLNDADTGYHIRAGEFILKTSAVPHHDLFSFIRPTLPWTAHEWLAEVIMAFIHSLSGLTGVVVFFSFLIAATYYLLFRFLRQGEGNIYLAAGLTILVFASSQLHWLARPHIFSLLLMVVWYWLLDAYEYNRRNWLYWMPLIMLVWVNLHGGFIAGFILLGIYGGANLIKIWQTNGSEQETARNRFSTYIVVSLACLIASLINPFGYKILLFPFNLVNNKYIMDHVSEFVSPNFHDPLPFKYLFLLTIAVLTTAKKRLNLIEFALILFFTNMALVSIRYVTLFSIIAAPIVFRRCDDLLATSGGRWGDLLKRRNLVVASIDARSTGFLWPFVGVMAVVFLMVGGKLNYQFNPKLKPVAAVEFLKREPISGNMFNNDEMGDYIIYAAWPQYQVFFDGRSDMYGAERMKEYFRITGFESGWEKVLEKYGITWIIYDAQSALTRYLRTQSSWKLIYADQVAQIFVKDLPQYQYLIEKYRHIRPLPALPAP